MSTQESFQLVVVSAGTSDPSSTRLLADRTAQRATELAALILAEQTCCSFLNFTLRFEGSTVVMTLTAPDPAQPIISDLTGGDGGGESA